MFRKYFSLMTSSAAVLTLAACAVAHPVQDVVDGQYWQRINTSESIYMQGPKAMQLLNRSIARCVVELREFERLGMVRNAIPADIEGRVLDPDQQNLDDWDAPERDGVLFAEHFDYQDFEGCMYAKGWERVEYLPYDVSIRSRAQYLEEQAKYKYNTNYASDPSYGRRPVASSQQAGDFGSLNN